MPLPRTDAAAPPYARQSAATGATQVLVVTPTDGAEVVASYAWCMAAIAVEGAPPRLRRGAGRYPQPVALLARLSEHPTTNVAGWVPRCYGT